MVVVQFDKIVRFDEGVIMISGCVGKVVLIKVIFLLCGDSVLGKVVVDIELFEMLCLLQNVVMVNMQVWFVFKGVFLQFLGLIDLMYVYMGEQIKILMVMGEDVWDVLLFFFEIKDFVDIMVFE